MRQLFSPRLLSFTVALLCAGVATSALARKKKRPPPVLQLVVKKGKKILGTEVLRTKRSETKTYHSTKTKMRQNGRSFVHRTHTILDPKNNFVTYDRWLDVKGATLRIRVFRFKDTFKKVEFAQQKKHKNKVATIKTVAPLVVLDERSPVLVDLAIDRFLGRTELNWVRADDLTTGTMKLTIERLVDGSGAKWSRYLLTGKGLKATVLRGADQKAVHIDTGWGYTGTAKGKKVPKNLQPDTSAPAEKPDASAPAEKPDASAPAEKREKPASTEVEGAKKSGVAAKVDDAARPKEKAAKPKEKAAKPKEKAAKPKEKAAKPKEKAAKPKVAGGAEQPAAPKKQE